VVVSVLLFRIFDQWKPWPARGAEKLREGWGVVMDDVFAGLWGVAVVLALRTAGWL
jgi:phosphatidylglycerophosphatase A